MSTSYTLPSQAIIVDAMQIMQALGQDEAPNAADYDVCMKGLQGILKELPIHGLSWPKITADPVLLVWDPLVPARVAMPADYFGVPDVSYTDNGQRVPVRICTKMQFEEPDYPIILNPPFPKVRKLYIAPNNVGYLSPVPTTDPLLYITYQAIVMDATQTAMPDVLQCWIAGLGLWLAHVMGPKFSVPLARQDSIEKRYLVSRALMLSYATETAPIVFQVAD